MKMHSNKIANMSFVCACLVVLIHAPGIITGSSFNAFVLDWIKGGVTMVAVPIFFIISGYLLGRHICEPCWYKVAIKRRIKSLVIPFFVLNILWFLFKGGVHYIGVRYLGADGSSQEMDFTLLNVFRQMGFVPWGGNAVTGFWYIRSLFYLVLLSPVLAWFILKGRLVSSILVTALLGLWCLQSRIDFAHMGWLASVEWQYSFSMRCPLYFSIGMILSRNSIGRLSRLSSVAIIIMAVLALVLLKRYPVEERSLEAMMVFLTTLLLGLSIWVVIPSSRWYGVLVENSFPLFALHGIILYVIPIPLKVLGLWNSFICKVGVLPIWVLVVMLTLLFALMLKRYFPRFSNVIFGGRC